jgi:hypothetical protein
VISIGAGPHKVAKNSNLLSGGIALEGPTPMRWAVGGQVIKEIRLEDGIVFFQAFLFITALHITEVRIAADAESLGS